MALQKAPPAEIRKRGIEALTRALGPVGLVRFLQQFELGSSDYTRDRDEEGYFAFCPELQGCYTQCETYEEVLNNIKDAIRLHIEDRLEAGEGIPQPESVTFATLEVAV
jgi:predicted RNase H-like HicB family nuclease